MTFSYQTNLSDFRLTIFPVLGGVSFLFLLISSKAVFAVVLKKMRKLESLYSDSWNSYKILQNHDYNNQVGDITKLHYAQFTRSCTSVRPCNCRNLSSILCLGKSLRLVDFSTNSKREKQKKKLRGRSAVALRSTCRIANFCLQVVVLLLVNEELIWIIEGSTIFYFPFSSSLPSLNQTT